MPLTSKKATSAAAATSAATPSSLLCLALVLLVPLVVVLAPMPACAALPAAEPTADQYDLHELLYTETVLIDTLRRYIETLQGKISLIKRKTLQIKAIHDVALADVDKYLNNPLNALTIMKRLTADWNALRRFARTVNSTTETVGNLTETTQSLTFPSDADFDEAAGNLLRIQGIYNLQPERLALGEVNGIKLGSAMSWSDCLEMGRVSVQNGDFTIAKFWMETALGKLPAKQNATAERISSATMTGHEGDKARFEIWQELLSAEYSVGNFESALDIANKMLEQHPNHKSVRQAKETIESELLRLPAGKAEKSRKQKKLLKKSDKSIEELLIEEICRDATTTTGASANSAGHCALVGGNLPQLLLQPLRVEYLSLDPYIVIHHGVLRGKDVSDLQNYIDEAYDGDVDGSVDVVDALKFTQIGQKKLQAIAERLHWVTGHASALFEAWKLDRWTFEDDVDAETLAPSTTRTAANVLFNVQQAKLGGAIVFPQLALSASIPQNALLYWTNLNEFHEYDYRTKQHVCPVIAGSQIYTKTPELQWLKMMSPKSDPVHNDYFSSIMGLESLLKTEELLLDNLRAYVETTKRHISVLDSELQRIEQEHAIAVHDTTDYLTNPVNVYRLMKRLTADWLLYEDRIQGYTADKHFIERMAQYRKTLSFPIQEDIDGAAAALVRLQDTYQLDAAEIAAGILNGIKYGTDMTWQDCFALGKQLFALAEYNHTQKWLKESMNRLSREYYYNDPSTFDYVELAASHLLSLGDFETALQLSNEVLKVEPERDKAWAVKNAILSSHIYQISPLTTQPCNYHATEEFQLYAKVCRGELTATPAQLRPLRCRYVHNNHPHHRFAPFKVEEHSLDPLVWTLHGVVTDQQINTLRQMAAPLLRRSTVRAVLPEYRMADFRISKNAWLPYERHEYLQRMLHALNAVTGLETSRSESLQVANYGLGGHYEPHWDFYLKTEEIPAGGANRIATAVFYFSDVEQGGATAFPFLNISVKPQKGNALFWYNLHRSLEGDFRTKHAGCPVLKGSKWIANVWISDVTQTFARPCGLRRDGEVSKKYEIVK